MLFRLSGIVLAGVFGGLAVFAYAQDPAFLVPKAFTVSQKTAKLSLVLGDASAPVSAAWASWPVRWVFVKTGEFQENRDTVNQWLGSDGSFDPPIPAPGAVMVGVDFQPRLEQVDSSRLAGLVLLRSNSNPSLVVRHYRSAIALLRTQTGTAQDEEGSAVATTETSLSATVHAFMDPTRLMLGGAIAFEVSVQGEEVEGSRLFVKCLATGEVTQLETETNMCHFTPKNAGAYEVCFQYARRTTNDPEAQYDLFSGTMTFSIPTPQGVKK